MRRVFKLSNLFDIKVEFNKELNNNDSINSYKEFLDYLYDNEIMVSSINLIDVNPNELLNLIFDYKNKYNDDYGFIYFVSNNPDLINKYNELYYKFNNEFNRKKDSISKDIDKVYQSSKGVLIFKDTRLKYINNQTLIDSITNSKENTKLYDDNFSLDLSKYNKLDGIIEVIDNRKVSSSISYSMKGISVGVSNTTNLRVGAEVLKGKLGSEESLCFISTLYPSMNIQFLYDEYYKFNKESNGFNTSKVIYTPNVTIFKTDERYPESLKEDDWYKINVLTLSMPDQNRAIINDDDLYDIMKKRIELLFLVAIENNIKVLILDDLNSNELLNNPYVLANVYKELIDTYRYYFNKIIFSIPTRNMEKTEYLVLKRILKL